MSEHLTTTRAIREVPAIESVTGNTLIDELREVCLDKKYDHMTIATVLGVLEMLKHEMMMRNHD